MSVPNDMPGRDNARSARSINHRGGKPSVPPDFADMVADHRACGRTDDQIAASFGLSIGALQKRLGKLGVPLGRRWRDIEDTLLEHNNPVLSKREARAVLGSNNLRDQWAS